LLPHRAWVRLNDSVEVYCYQSRQLDSALAVRAGGSVLLNLNDCEASPNDLARLRGDLGPVDVLLNQFSIAGFDGSEEKLAKLADQILDNMVRDHRTLEAGVTIPFASLVYFCCPDNKMINSYANSPVKVADRFKEEGLDLAVLKPGDALVIGAEHDSSAALAYYKTLYEGIGDLPLNEPPVVELDKIIAAFDSMVAKLRKMHGRAVLRLLKPVVISVPDLDKTLIMSFRDGYMRETEADPDVEINSQPLSFMLSNAFGLQTLGVSGRYRLIKGLKNWFRHRALLAMLNAGIGLSVRQMVSRRQLAFFWRRRAGLVDQVRYRIERTFGR
jgi:hypothetical protein